MIRWFRRQGFLDAHAAAAMIAWEHSGFSIDASVRITLLDRDVPSYFESLEHLLRYCARPPFALQRRSGNRDADGRIARGPPTDWGELVQVHDDRDVFQASDRRAARDRHPQPLTAAGRGGTTKPPDSERLRADGEKNDTSGGKAGAPGTAVWDGEGPGDASNPLTSRSSVG